MKQHEMRQITMKYSEYKNDGYDEFPCVEGSYDAVNKTIVVIIPSFSELLDLGMYNLNHPTMDLNKKSFDEMIERNLINKEKFKNEVNTFDYQKLKKWVLNNLPLQDMEKQMVSYLISIYKLYESIVFVTRSRMKHTKHNIDSNEFINEVVVKVENLIQSKRR